MNFEFKFLLNYSLFTIHYSLYYKLLVFFGLHPLCGTGVISNIALSSTPQDISHLIACSLPAQIHLT